MQQLIATIKDRLECGHRYPTVAGKLGIKESTLYNLLKGDISFLSTKTVRIVYRRAGLIESDELRAILASRNKTKIDNFKPTNSILGSIFRLKRLQLGREMEDVARMIKASERSIRRIEEGDALSSYRSYIITQLISTYQFTEQEAEKIRRFIVIVKDLITMAKRYSGKSHGL